jgi:hypothetical protein
MQRAVETTAWFYDWLENNSAQRAKRWNKYAYKCALFSRPVFSADYQSNCVRLNERTNIKNQIESNTTPLMRHDLLWQQYDKLSTELTDDIVLLAKMSLCALFTNKPMELIPTGKTLTFGMEDVITYDLPECEMSERVRCHLPDKTIYIFFTRSIHIGKDIPRIVARMCSERERVKYRIIPLCILVDSGHTLLEDSAKAVTNHIAVVGAEHMRSYIKSAVKYGWNTTTIGDQLSTHGPVIIYPDGAMYAGRVIHFYGKHGSISVDNQNDREICSGDYVIVYRNNRWRCARIQTIQHNKMTINRAIMGVIGIVTELQRKDVRVGSHLFFLKADTKG